MTSPPEADHPTPDQLQQELESLTANHTQLASSIKTWKVAISAGATVLSVVLGFFGLNQFQGWVPLLQIRGAAGSPGVGAPVGAIVAWQSDALPVGSGEWRICDGEPTTFSVELWRALSGLYGNDEFKEGASLDAIKLPDFRGMFLRGAGGSRKPGSRQSASKPSAPSITWYDHRITKDPVSKAMVVNAGHGTPSSYFSHLSLSPVDEDHRPVNYAVHWIIRVK